MFCKYSVFASVFRMESFDTSANRTFLVRVGVCRAQILISSHIRSVT